jgi:pyruvate kinase
VAHTFEPLPRVVKPGDRLFLNDGLIQLIVDRVDGTEVHCTVAVGGDLSSKKGLNLPGIDLGIRAFTAHDRDCLAFALEHGVDAVSQSFVERAADIEVLREAARELGRQPFVIAKIERADALAHLDEILQAADGIMVARGDLGVEVPIERIAIIQKDIITRANAAGKPVITATQMLESMITSRLPTRAEATDVANAILDGTDCVMLSGESAVGKFPVDAVATLARIAAHAEQHRGDPVVAAHRPAPALDAPVTVGGALAEVVGRIVDLGPVSAVFVPTASGATARMMSRFKLRVWVVALSSDPAVCQSLAFSYGVNAIHTGAAGDPDDWKSFTAEWLAANGLPVRLAVLVAGPSPRNPDANLRIEFLHVWSMPQQHLKRT